MATDIGKAYIQIVPSAQGISGSLSSVLSGEGTDAGTAAGNNFASAIKSVIAAAGITAAVKSVLDAGMSFDSSMSQVAATMGTTVDQIQDLRDFAQEMGATTAFSATEAADALNYMALAGYDAETAMNMLPTVLNLAAAGSIDLARASDMVTDASSALGLDLEETAQMVDIMAKAASSSNTSVEQLGEAMLKIGGTAKNLDGGTTELATAFGILADNGIKGSEAGTHLRNILLSLTPKSEDAAKAMESLGFNAYDADGNLRPLNETFADLAMSLEGMSTEQRQSVLANIFNKTDLAAVDALLSATTMDIEGISEAVGQLGIDWSSMSDVFDQWGVSAEEGMQEVTELVAQWIASGATMEETIAFLHGTFGMTEADAVAMFNTVNGELDEHGNRWMELTGLIEDADGAAKAMAETQLDNLAGDITLFQSALEGAKIALSDILTPALRSFVQEGSQLLSDFTTTLNEEGLTAAIIGLVQGLVETGVSTVVSGIQTLTANVPELVDAGVQIVSELIVGLLSAIPEIAAAALDLIFTLAETLLTYDWVGTANDLVTRLQTNLDTSAAAIFGADTSIIDGVIQGITVGLPLLLQQAVDLITQFLASITEQLPTVVTQGTEILTQLINGVITALPTLAETAGQLITTVTGAIAENLPLVLDAGVSILTEIITGLANTLPEITGVAAEVISTLLTQLTTLLPDVLAAGTSILNEIVNGIVTALPTLLAQASELITQFCSSITLLLPTVLSSGSDILTNIVNGILQLLPTLVTTAGDIINTIINTVAENLPLILQTGIDLLLQLAQGIIDSLPDMADAVLEVIGTILQTITDNLPDILAAGIEIVAQLILGLVEMHVKMQEAAQEVIDKIKGKFDEFDWKSIGTNLLEGIKNGILGAVESLANAAKSAAETVWEKITGVFSVNSPSRKGIWLGQMIDEGIALGIRDSIGTVEDAIDVLDTRANTALETGMSANLAYAPSGSDAVSRLDAILGLMERYLPECAENGNLDGVGLMRSINRELGLAAI